jgi:hypothetical protein
MLACVVAIKVFDAHIFTRKNLNLDPCLAENAELCFITIAIIIMVQGYERACPTLAQQNERAF